MSDLKNYLKNVATNAEISVGQPVFIGQAWQTSDQTLSGGSVQDLPYSDKNDPFSMIDISGGTMKFTVPLNSTGVCRIKSSLSPQSSWNMSNGFVSLPLVYKTSDNSYQGVGDRYDGTWVSGENTNGAHFPKGELIITLTPGTQYTVKSFIDTTMVNTGNRDGNFTFIEVW